MMTHKAGAMTGAHGVMSIRENDDRDRWQVVCLATVEDEDAVPHLCGWEGPVRDHLSIAWDDAVQHLHDRDGRCLYCQPCRDRIGLQ